MEEELKITEGDDGTLNLSLNNNSVDKVLERSQRCGCFQVSLHLVIAIVVLTFGYQNSISNFTDDSPPWKCISNTSSLFCEENYEKEISVNNPKFSERCKLNRSEWRYTTVATYSLVTELDLVCDKEINVDLTKGAFYIGAVFGTIIFGYASDAYGRRLILLICLTATICLSIISSYIKKIWHVILLRALIGATYMSCNNVAFVMLLEFVGPFFRPVSANVYRAVTRILERLITHVVYPARNWRKLQFFTSLPCFISLILVLFMPKSPRWLLAVGNTSEAEGVFNKVAQINPKSLEKITQETTTNPTSNKRYTYFHLFKHSKTAVITLSQSLLWLTIGLLYHITNKESSNLAKGVLTASTTIPSNIAAVLMCRHLGRKKAVLVSVLLSSLFTPLIHIVSLFSNTLNATLYFALLAHFFAQCANGAIYVWTFELFPTVIRTQGWSICIIFGLVSEIIAPSLIIGNKILNYIIICILGVVSSFIGLVLPETLEIPYREKYDDFQ